MLVDKFHPTPSPSTRVEGLLGRLMRAFPARVLAAQDLAVGERILTAPATIVPPKAGLLARVDAWLWRLQQRETEAWLGQSKDASELEYRMRTLERGDAGYNRF